MVTPYQVYMRKSLVLKLAAAQWVKPLYLFCRTTRDPWAFHLIKLHSYTKFRFRWWVILQRLVDLVPLLRYAYCHFISNKWTQFDKESQKFEITTKKGELWVYQLLFWLTGSDHLLAGVGLVWNPLFVWFTAGLRWRCPMFWTCLPRFQIWSFVWLAYGIEITCKNTKDHQMYILTI